jgi:Insertion element 4 transposase N-terminal/Transposase DDE domain
MPRSPIRMEVAVPPRANSGSLLDQALRASALDEALRALNELGPEGGLERFAASLDPEWIEQALVETGTASIRRRKLPADQVVWLVLGMCLFADRSIVDMVDHLKLVLPGVKDLAPSNVTKARYRLGPQPLRWLFEKVAGAWGDTPGLAGYHGLRLYGIDGSHLRVQDTDENFEHFGKPGGRNGGGDAGYPQLRLVGLMNLSNRLLTAIEAGPWSQGEQTLVKPLTQKIPDHSLTIVDRGFYAYLWIHELLSGGTERHVMVRAKKNLKYEIVEVLPDGSALARVRPHKKLHKEHPELPESILLRVIEYQLPGGEPSRLFVSLLDPIAYPAEELVSLYHERWELELGFDEIKTHMLERKECLRSKKPEGVYQELWGQLLTYNLVRREMMLAAQAHGLPPKQISFRSSLLWIRNFWITAGLTRSPGNIPKHLAELRSTLDVLILPERRTARRYPRHVKIKMSNYKRNRGRRNDNDTEPIDKTDENA